MEDRKFDPTFDSHEHEIDNPKCCSLGRHKGCDAIVHMFCGYGYMFYQCENGHEISEWDCYHTVEY